MRGVGVSVAGSPLVFFGWSLVPLCGGVPRIYAARRRAAAAGLRFTAWGTPRCRDRSRGNLGRLPVVGCSTDALAGFCFASLCKCIVSSVLLLLILGPWLLS